MRYGEKSAAAREVQKKLEARGYTLPRYGADGQLGEESWDALQRYAADNGLPWAPEVPQLVVDLLLRGSQDVTVEIPAPVDGALPAGMRFYNLVPEQTDPHPKSRVVHGKTVRRAPSSITGVTIHQTAVVFGATKGAIAHAGGDKELAVARRALNVACHMLAFDGFIAQPAPLDWYLYHGNGFNGPDLGLEIEGRYPGLIGGRVWGDKPETDLTEQRVETARTALRLLVSKGREAGYPIKYVHAHRQTSDTRRSDPGEALWKAVVLEYGVPKLGLVTESGKVLRKGRPVPLAWDEKNGVGDY